MARVFVSGANGFIGVHLVEFLLERGDEVTALVRPTSDVRNLAALEADDKLRIVTGDVARPETLGPGLDDAEIVFHLAAELMVTSEAAFQRANHEGTRNLLATLLRGPHDALKRFLFVSSQAAAGPGEDATPQDETRTPQPISWYGHSKKDAEAAVREAGESGLPFTIVRPVAVYGERERDISGGMFPAVKNGLRPVIGLHTKHTSFVYVKDLVEGIVGAAESDATLGKIYFLADPEPYVAKQVFGAIADAMGKKVRIPLPVPHVLLWLVAVFSEWWLLFARGRPTLTRDKWREMKQKFWGCSPAAALADFGWQARTGLLEGMKRATADWAERKRLRRQMVGLPDKDRAVMTYSLCFLAGVLLEAFGVAASLYHFAPWWVLIISPPLFFGAAMGTMAYLTGKAATWLQFLAGCVIGIGAEFLNDHLLHAWTFGETITNLLPDVVVRSIVLGMLDGGLTVVIVNALVRLFHGRRLRMG